jgi:hypothetical protein
MEASSPMLCSWASVPRPLHFDGNEFSEYSQECLITVLIVLLLGGGWYG